MDSLLTGRRVLVVEDETMILMMIEAMLEDLGCQAVTSVGTVEDAIHQVETKTFDIALLDMNLGGVDSCDVADALAFRGVPFAYATGDCRRDMKKGFVDRDVLRKPFTFAQFTSTLTSLVPRLEVV